MRGSISKLVCIGFLSLGSILTVTAQNTNIVTNTPSTTAPAQKSMRHLPFRGTIAGVDKTARSITLLGKANQVIHVTSRTKLTKGSEPATFDDLTIKTKVTGSKNEVAPNKWEATSLRITTVSAVK